MIYTALARMAATAGEPDQALQAARSAVASGHPVKLRSFVPALRAYCAAGNFDQAFAVRCHQSDVLLSCMHALVQPVHHCALHNPWCRFCRWTR